MGPHPILTVATQPVTRIEGTVAYEFDAIEKADATPTFAVRVLRVGTDETTIDSMRGTRMGTEARPVN
jgi:hypothetical protein